MFSTGSFQTCYNASDGTLTSASSRPIRTLLLYATRVWERSSCVASRRIAVWMVCDVHTASSNSGRSGRRACESSVEAYSFLFKYWVN